METESSREPNSSANVEENRPKTIVLQLGGFCEQILSIEAQTLKLLGMDNVPLHELLKYHSDFSSITQAPDTKPSQLEKSQSPKTLESLVVDFVKAVTDSGELLHQTVETIPQNRPFGGHNFVDRLLAENIAFMDRLVEFDKVNK